MDNKCMQESLDTIKDRFKIKDHDNGLMTVAILDITVALESAYRSGYSKALQEGNDMLRSIQNAGGGDLT